MTTPAPHIGPELTAPSVPHLRAGIVAARWHEELTTGLLGGAQRALRDAEIEAPTVLRVPGSFELPVVAARLARGGCDAVGALGGVVEGTAAHVEDVCHGVTPGRADGAGATGGAVGRGVATVE